VVLLIRVGVWGLSTTNGEFFQFDSMTTGWVSFDSHFVLEMTIG